MKLMQEPYLEENEEKIENNYESKQFILQDLIGQSRRSKNVYKYMYDNCKDYDKEIFKRIYTNEIKHYKMLREIIEKHFGISNDDETQESINYKKYNAEKCIIDTYDMLDDYTKIYTNAEDDDVSKDMLFEIIQDLQKNISMLSLVYIGEE